MLAGVPDVSPAPFDWYALLNAVLVLGTFLAAVRLGRSLYRLGRLLRQPGQYQNGLRVVPTTGGNASFFHHVLLNDTALTPAERTQVLLHEAEHARRYHSLDRLLIEVLLLPFWWNPVLYAYRAALVEVHEWEVDAALTRHLDRRAYAALLLKLHTAPLPLANLLGRRPLRARIERILQPKPSAAVKKTLFLLALPVGIGALLAFGKPYTPDFATGTDSIAGSDSIRFYESDRWGPNPLIVIDEKRYPASILTRIDPLKMSGSSIYPANLPKVIEKYGPEAKDGVLKLTTKKKDGVFAFDNDRDYRITVENTLKERAIPKDQFFTRYTITDRATGQLHQAIKIQQKGGGGMSNDLKPGQKIYYLLDKKVITEEQLIALRPEIIDRINSRGTGEVKYYSKEWRKQFEPGSVLMWMSTTGEQLETDPPRPPKPAPAPAPPAVTPPDTETPPAPPAPQELDASERIPLPKPVPGAQEVVALTGFNSRMPIAMDWNTFHNSRGNQTIAQNGCRIQKFKRLNTPGAILMVLSFDVNTHQISMSEYERFRQEFIKMGYDAQILELKSDPKTHQYESVRASLRNVKTGKSVTATVNLRDEFTLNGQRMQAKITGFGFFVTVADELEIHARMDNLRAVLTTTPVANPVPISVPTSAPTPQPDERPGVLERVGTLSRMCLNLAKYSPAFLERAKQFFKEEGEEVTVANERFDAAGNLLSVDIRLRRISTGQYALIDIKEKDSKTGWIYIELKRGGYTQFGPLPTPPDPAKPIYSAAQDWKFRSVWSLLQPEGC
jgi:hypothetical protein